MTRTTDRQDIVCMSGPAIPDPRLALQVGWITGKPYLLVYVCHRELHVRLAEGAFSQRAQSGFRSQLAI